MTVDDSRSANEELQFDRVTPAGSGATAGQAVVCKGCGTRIQSDYYTVNGSTTCASCKDAVVAAVSTPKDLQLFARSAALGALAAIVGAAIYYAVALAGVEIAIIAIACGYMVGWAIKKGNGGRGGLRFQILAVVLTYWSVGLAYLPLVLDLRTIRLTPFLALYAFELPVLVITHEGASAILSVIIIGIGLRYAWQMTAAPRLQLSGPHRVGSGPSTTAA
jgi:hypothetical protein